MTVVSLIAAFIVLWFVVFFMVNPFWQTSQHEAGEVEPGTPSSAPVNMYLKRKAVVTTVLALVAYGAIAWVVTHHLFSLDDIPFFVPPK